MTFGIIADYQYYINPSDPVKAYIGIGPAVSVSYISNNNNWPLMSTSSWSIGLRICLGAEWFMTKNLSLFAEYGLIASFKQQYEVIDPEVDSGPFTINSFIIDPLNIQLGIAAYL